MKADITSVSDTRSVLSIVIPAEEVRETRAGVVKAACAEAELPGFRKGKAPAAMVEKKFAARIREESEERSVRKAFDAAVNENKLAVFEIVSIDDKATGDDGSLSFKATVDLVPSFPLPKTEGIAIDDTKTAVTDEQVNEQLEGFRRTLAKYEDLKEGEEAKDEDMLNLDYTATVDGAPLSEKIPDAASFAEKKGSWCTVGSEYFIVPGLPKEMVGKKIGDTGTFETTFPADFYKESLRGVKAVYTWTVTGGRKYFLPEIGPADLKRFQLETVDQLRDLIRKNLEDNAAQMDRSRHIGQIADAIALDAKFALPAAELERQTEHILSHLLRQNMDKGVSKEDLSKEREKLSASAKEQAEKNMRLEFILDAIRKDKDIKVTDQEFMAFLNGVVRRERLTDAQQKELSKNQMALRRYYQAANREKVFTVLLEKAVPTAGFKA